MKTRWSVLGVCGIAFIALFLMGQARQEELYTYAQGTGNANNTTTSAVVVTSPGAGFFNSIERVVVSCFVAAAGGGGEVHLRNSGTIIWTSDADAVGTYIIDFGPRGHRADTANTSLDLEVGAAGTTQATCIATGIAHVTR